MCVCVCAHIANNSELSLPTTNDCRDKDTSDHVTEVGN